MRIALTSLLLWCAGCTPAPDAGKADQPGASRGAAGAAGGVPALARRAHAFADLPDRGDLVAYPAQRVVRQDGAYTWHRASLSEEHALRAVGGGVMHFTTPAGAKLQFKYERHVEHPSGDWTWIGRAKGGAAADEVVLTFGEKAVFGTISQPGQAPLKLTMGGGVSWLIETDRSQIADIDNPATRPRTPDFLIPPKITAALGASAESTQAGATTATTASASALAAATTTVDVLLGYTGGFAAAQGGPSQAVTRLNNMVEITNQAYVNSQVEARVRLVHAMQVSYADNTSNDSALEALTGFRAPSTRTTPDPAFAALRSARDQYGADLVSLVRDFNTPENDGCGIAWLIGGGQTGIDRSDEYFGYSVVSDGRDVGSDGKTYFCREETLAHELGHNMGSQHDRVEATEDGKLKYGLYPYSFGYKPSGGSIYTVMAYGDTGQTSYRVFSNPRTVFCGVPCGVENEADNARSLGQAMPQVAAFRATVVAPAAPSMDLFAIAKLGGSQSTEIHSLAGTTTFQTFSRHLATALHQTGSDYAWQFQLGDYNRDGYVDLYVIAKQGGSGTTEVHVLNGADGFQSYLLHAATALHQTGSDNGWVFRVGDYNRDGVLDLYAIGRNGGTGRTDVHVLDGASNFRSFLAQIATALHSTGSDASWDFALADYNRDGAIDLFAIYKLGGSGTTEVHILNGQNAFQSYLLNTATALHQTGTTNAWVFKVGDYNSDGYPDVYAISKQGASSRTEVHVLDGAQAYRVFSAHIATALHSTGTDNAWEFELGGPR